jgi:hypothetical protein
MTAQLVPDLAEAVADFAAGAIDALGFCALFDARTVYAVRPQGQPALAAYPIAGTVGAPVFSSLAALARWCVHTADERGPLCGVDWFAATGADLMSFWPPECDLVIDPGSPHAIRHPAKSMRAEGLLTMQQRQAGDR